MPPPVAAPRDVSPSEPVATHPATVPDDRHGVADSIVDRMWRHGGVAVVRSTPGEGTEVRLSLPLEKDDD